MSFEEDIAKFHEFYFFHEFTFSQNKFRRSPAEEVELADNIVWIDEPLIVYQLKERQAPSDTTPEKEEKWFKRNIIRLATRQIRDTLNYLQNHKNNIQVQNHRGHTFDITVASLDSVHKLVLYKAHKFLPESCLKKKHHKSSTAGFIHLISSDDYLGLVKTLITPTEFANYLTFREALIINWEEETLNLPEQALVGHYLSGDSEHKPSLYFVKYLRLLEHNPQEWDMSGIIRVFSERITTNNPPTDYYCIVKELAKLQRHELREFKIRFNLSIERAKANELEYPNRIAVLSTKCGFVFVPLTCDFMKYRREALQNFTLLHKYDKKLPKCIGISFAVEDDGYYDIEWCYMEFPWKHDPNLEYILQQKNPFYEVRPKILPLYNFDNE